MTRLIFILLITALITSGAELAGGEYFVTQSWSQETDFKRAYYVHVPEQAGAKKLPALIFLHGNGGNARGAMHSFLRKHRTIASRYVLAFANGYQKSWNIVSERAKSDDRGFIESIVTRLVTFDNVQPDTVTIMGSSNGAALVNQMAVECRLPNIRNYVAVVSPLNVWQYDGKVFKAKGDDNNYREAVTPLTGKRLMSISGTEDRLVPYSGGPSKGIPAKGGKLAFVDAEESIFIWAKAMGYRGKKLSEPTRIDGKQHVFSYLEGDVVLVKVIGEGHGAGRELREDQLLAFLEGAR